MATAARPAARKPAAAKPVAATGKGAGRGGFFRRGKVPAKVLADFTSQLATVVNAGLPLVRCLRILEAQQKPGPFQLVVEAVADDVEGGATLSESLAKYPQVFDRLYINMVRAGEAGGVLGTILERLATFAQKTETIKRQIRSAMIYPIMVLSFAGLVTAFVLAFVVPKFKSIFESFGAEMPTPTLVLMTLSDFILDWWYLLGLVPVVVVALWRVALRNDSFAYTVDRWKLKMPLVGRLQSKTIVARFARTLGTLLASGVPILESLAIVRASIPNLVLEEAVGDVHDAIREGETMAEPLADSGVFDDLVVNMIDVGEETGQLDSMLLRVADNYEDEVDTEVAGVLKAIEPLIIFVMAIVVGGIVVSLFLPVVKIMDTFQGA